MEVPSPERTSGARRGRRFALAVVAAALAIGTGCGEGSPGAIAVRILDRYRRATGSKPLTAGGMIRLRLASPKGSGAGEGTAEILWEPSRYRESTSSAGWTAVRGIESGKAYFTDPDGVTRVVSDPVLRELTTRSYFWRKAWLFRDREGARVRLGPASADEVAIQLQPAGGYPLRLSFSRRSGRLLAVHSPRFELAFETEARFHDRSDPRRPFDGEVVWRGLPTGRMPRPTVGGGRAQFADASSRIPYDQAGGLVVVPARIGDESVRLAVDATVDGPVRISPALAGRLRLPWKTDVFSRRIAGGVSLELGGARYPSLFVEAFEDLPAGADASAGGCLFRETVVELDPETRRLGLHDPERWVTPEDYFRVVIDDDGDLPVAVLDRGSQALRVVVGSDTGEAALELAPESADRLGLDRGPTASGMLWGAARLPPLPFRVVPDRFAPAWGDDGRLGFPLLLRFHAYVQMPQRWIYLSAARRADGTREESR